MGAEIKTAEAAAGSQTELTAGAGISGDILADVFKRHGVKPPGALKVTDDKSKAAAKAKEEADAKAKADAEAEGDEGKTEEELEAEATAKEEADAKAKADAEAEGDEGKTEEELEAEATAKEEADAKAKADAEAEADPETAKLVKTKLKDLPEAQREIAQSIINERIGEITRKSKDEIDRLGHRVTELNSELEAARKDKGTPVTVAGVHPALLLETPAQIDAFADSLDSIEDLLAPYRDGGIEADEATGRAAFTPEQIRAKLREIQRDRDRVLPQARSLISDRAKLVGELKAKLPGLYDPTTEEFRQADKLRRQLPELRRLPDAESFVAKWVLGAKALADLEKNTKTRTVTKAAPGKSASVSTTRKAPRSPGDGSPAFGSPLDDPRRQQRPDIQGAARTFAKTRSRSDLIGAVSAVMASQ